MNDITKRRAIRFIEYGNGSLVPEGISLPRWKAIVAHCLREYFVVV